MNEFPLTIPTPEGYSKKRDFYPPHPHANYRWGMAIDLDRCIFHKNIDANPVAKRNKLFEEHADDIVMEKDLPREEWFVLKAKKPGVSARKLAKQYGLQELRDYMDYSREEIDKMRQDEK